MNLPILEKYEGNSLGKSVEVIVLTKHNNFQIGCYYHSLNEWMVDYHYRNNDYILEWWPLPEIGTGNK